ncbi:MAG TPA: hypothetical protein VFZ37_04435 [Jiangellaceae bacterium]
MDMKNVVRLGGQALAAGGAVKSLRQARTEHDKLKLLDAIVHALAIATAVALIIRELREERAEQED